jgi:hypothetical protein
MTQKFIYFYYLFCSVFYNLIITQERASAAPGGPSVNSQVQESFLCSMIALQYSRMRHNGLKMSFQSFRVSLHSPQLQLNINGSRVTSTAPGEPPLLQGEPPWLKGESLWIQGEMSSLHDHFPVLQDYPIWHLSHMTVAYRLQLQCDPVQLMGEPLQLQGEPVQLHGECTRQNGELLWVNGQW